jgi:MerR family copper efflux transcriptional regulator
MRIGELARQTGTTAHSIRFYERSGVLPSADRAANGYREYDAADEERLRLLIGLRRLDLPLEQASELASLCLDGRCQQSSNDLRAAIADKRNEVQRRLEELNFLDMRLAHMSGQLSDGLCPKELVAQGREVQIGA